MPPKGATEEGGASSTPGFKWGKLHPATSRHQESDDHSIKMDVFDNEGGRSQNRRAGEGDLTYELVIVVRISS